VVQYSKKEGEMMKWIENLKNISKGDLGKCPCCGKSNIKSNFQKIKADMGYGDIWCEDCKNAFHISRLKITDELIKNNSDKPHGLKY
jgi:RNA polymerase-binding transcription factor DksA